MPQHFYIAALCRCRTAWLANLLTTDQSTCLHEQLGRRTLRQRPYIGWADTLFCRVADQVQLDGPLVVLTRDAAESFASTCRIYPGFTESERKQVWENTNACLQGAWELAERYDAPVFAAEDLDKAHVVETIWKRLLPGLPWDRDRYDMLRPMKVVNDPYLMARRVTDEVTARRWVGGLLG